MTSAHYGRQTVNDAYNSLMATISTDYVPLYLGFSGTDPDLNHIRKCLQKTFKNNAPRAYIVLNDPDDGLKQSLKALNFVVLPFDAKTEGYQPVTDLLAYLFEVQANKTSAALPASPVRVTMDWRALDTNFRENKYHQISLKVIGRSQETKHDFNIEELYTRLKTSEPYFDGWQKMLGKRRILNSEEKFVLHKILRECGHSFAGRPIERAGETARDDEKNLKKITKVLLEIAKRKILPVFANLVDEVARLTSLEPDEIKFALAQLCEISQQKTSLEEVCWIHKHSVISGGAGSGKTTMLRLAAIACLEALDGSTQKLTKYFKASGLTPTPVYARLEDIGKNKTDQENLNGFLGYIAGQIDQDGDITKERLRVMLRQGDIWLLLDGLDEIDKLELRIKIAKLLGGLPEKFPNARITVTTRPYGLSYGVGEYLGAFDHFDVIDIDNDQIVEFVNLFMSADCQNDSKMAKTRSDSFLQDLRDSPAALELAHTLLMLTIMAVIHERANVLPDKRTTLYQECLEQMLMRREVETGAVKSGGLVFEVENVKFYKQSLLNLLFNIAYRVHALEDADQIAITPALCKQVLQPTLTENNIPLSDFDDYANRFMQNAELKLALFVYRADNYFFAHRTFQEYLAAKFLSSRQESELTRTVKRLFGKTHWREVVILLFGILTEDNRDAFRRALFLDIISDFKTGKLNINEEAFFDLLSFSLKEMEGFPGAEYNNEIHRKFIDIADKRLAANVNMPVEYVKIGDALGNINEPKIDLFNPPIVTIPAGRFLYGDEKKKKSIKQPFAIGVYPVTNREFAEFIKDGGYDNKAYWDINGWKAKQKENWIQPSLWDNPKFGESRPLSPVVGVSWFEARAYCNWLKLRTGDLWRLPSELEWEAAARGKDGRLYPWGNDWDRTKNNSASFWAGKDIMGNREEWEKWWSSKAGDKAHTSAVGLFFQNSSPYGCRDMAGNVWEWCENWYDEAEEYKALRGGSWNSGADYARVAIRRRDNPGYRIFVIGFRLVKTL